VFAQATRPAQAVLSMHAVSTSQHDVLMQTSHAVEDGSPEHEVVVTGVEPPASSSSLGFLSTFPGPVVVEEPQAAERKRTASSEGTVMRIDRILSGGRLRVHGHKCSFVLAPARARHRRGEGNDYGTASAEAEDEVMSQGAPEVDAGVKVGDVLAGKYRVERVLGVGGMGVVVAAYHLQLEQRVALKFLLSSALRNPGGRARFDREARAAARIRGEHVARVLDVGQLENGAPYLVMEYLEGLDLAAWLTERGPLPVELAVDFVLQACEAVAEAHSLGIVHRDLKPANLFCVRRPDGLPSIKVLDFGISKMAPNGTSDGHMTTTSAVVGSPLYMSPEQMRSSREVDPRADVWALGVVLYELLTGHAPFEAETLPMLVLRIAQEPAPPVWTYRSDVPASLAAAISGCLVKDREGRHASVGALAAAIAHFGSDRGRVSASTIERVLAGTAPTIGVAAMIAPDIPPPARPVALDTTQAESSWGQSKAETRSPREEASRRSRVRKLGAALAVMGCAAAIGAFALSRDPHGDDGAHPKGSPSGDGATRDTGILVIDATTTDAATMRDAETKDQPPVTDAGSTPPLTRVTTDAAPPPKPPTLSIHPRSHDCDVPYYFDGAGNRNFKKECL
jgi:serine/threonine protein kinase